MLAKRFKYFIAPVAAAALIGAGQAAGATPATADIMPLPSPENAAKVAPEYNYLTYRLSATSYYSPPMDESSKAIIEKGIQIWNAALGFPAEVSEKFMRPGVQQWTNGRKASAIDFRLGNISSHGTVKHDCNDYVSVQGQTYNGCSAIVSFSKGEFTDPNYGDEKKLAYVLHEIGHALGLAHPKDLRGPTTAITNCAQVMYYTGAAPCQTASYNTAPEREEVHFVKCLYGLGGFTKRTPAECDADVDKVFPERAGSKFNPATVVPAA